MTLRTLYQSFLHSDMGRLRIIARQWGIEPYAVRHTDLAAELVDAMVDGEAISAVLSILPEDQKAALDAVLRQDGMMPWSSFLRRWGPMRDVGMGKMEREELWREPNSPAEGLWLLGFVQRDFTEHPSDPIEMAYVPEELSLYIPAPAALIVPPPQPVTTVAEDSRHVIDDNLAEDLVTWWVTLQRRQVDNLEKRTLYQLFSKTDLPIALLKAVSMEQGWVRETKGQELRLVPEPVLTWLRSDLWTQWSSVARAWLVNSQWQDLEHVESLSPDPVHDWLPDPVRSRKSILDLITLCELHKWYRVGEFVAYAKTHMTDFMRPDGNYERWAPRDAYTDRPLRGFECWESIEGAFIRFLISGPLSWLGIVNTEELVSDSQGDKLFHLTEAGAALLGVCEPPKIKMPPRISVNSSGVINVPVRRRYERYQLSRIAQFVDQGRAYRFRLSPRSLRRAQQQHIPLRRIVSFLEQATARPLPLHLKSAIERIYSNKEGASLENQWLLRLPDAADFVIPALQNLIIEQLTPTLVLIRKQDINRVLAILAENEILVDGDAL